MATYIESRDITIGEMLGSGSFGDVYKVKSKETNNEFAIKLVRDNSLDHYKEATELSIEPTNFQTELTRLKHANIIEFHGASMVNQSVLCLSMEYADCGSLFDLLHVKKTELEYSKIRNLMRQCAKGLEYLHDQKTVHGNLKTANLLLFKSGGNWTLKLSDFKAVREFAFNLTEAVNTDAYKAPEVSVAQNTEMSDVFSFGVCFWEAVTGVKPSLPTPNVIETTLKAKFDSEKSEKVEEVVKGLIEQCWEKDPTRRPTMKMVSLLLGLQPNRLEDTSDDDYIHI